MCSGEEHNTYMYIYGNHAATYNTDYYIYKNIFEYILYVYDGRTARLLYLQ